MAAQASGGAVEVRETLQVALATVKRALDLNPTVDSLITIVNALVPLVEVAIQYNKKLDRPVTEIQMLETHMRAGEELVRNLSVNVSAENKRDLMEILSNVKQILEIYLEEDEDEDDSNIISVRSHDNVVLPIDMAAATTESVVLRDLIDSTGNGGEIPLSPIYHDIVQMMIAFCEHNHNFAQRLEDLVQRLEDLVHRLEDLVQRLEDLVHSHRTWLRRFVTSNRPVFLDLHRAADFLDIPNLMMLTSETMRAMRENDPEQISEWYLQFSILGVGEDVHNHADRLRGTAWLLMVAVAQI